MHSYAIKSLVTCVLGAAILAGCGSPPAAPVAASTPGNMQRGKVIVVETVAASGQPMSVPRSGPSSGESAGGTTASSTPTVVTVQFADGTQNRYMVEQPRAAIAVGDPVNIITDGDRVTMMVSK
jgi:hypothetical protein